MPFIEYKCEKCGNEFCELYLTFNYPIEIKCEKCGELAKKLEVPTKPFGFNGTDLARARQ